MHYNLFNSFTTLYTSVLQCTNGVFISSETFNMAIEGLQAAEFDKRKTITVFISLNTYILILTLENIDRLIVTEDDCPPNTIIIVRTPKLMNIVPR